MPRADQKIVRNGDEIDRLRVNSRAKHLILKDYLPTWAAILGKWSTKINYIDCFAGPGEYYWKDEIVEGSPVGIRVYGLIGMSPNSILLLL